ncbi:hypothetical protein L3X38_017519 [Prunus dulcis]|uniref:Uncharacterized protein n=1 Tax=Prunus dulcis TaxID=3755 RepID=A0AAD4W898_PRUDU|nr:hypothetical protein L3X38_017519 [Prunus dulcis]
MALHTTRVPPSCFEIVSFINNAPCVLGTPKPCEARNAARIEVVSPRPARIAARIEVVFLRPTRMELMILRELTDQEWGMPKWTGFQFCDVLKLKSREISVWLIDNQYMTVMSIGKNYVWLDPSVRIRRQLKVTRCSHELESLRLLVYY